MKNRRVSNGRALGNWEDVGRRHQQAGEDGSKKNAREIQNGTECRVKTKLGATAGGRTGPTAIAQPLRRHKSHFVGNRWFVGNIRRRLGPRGPDQATHKVGWRDRRLLLRLVLLLLLLLLLLLRTRR